ncbi:hypothetical protein ANN_19727 [Periplaneta americana]|uniref:Uncharacterized protein n=1 Tax=Periplaneta americana TaxID=6978 RepID=A0ABQ8SB03_PERAM|nr:hypothetical protein ANN_19727 [Periplaneta americana]
MLAGSEFQSLGRAIVKEDEYEEVRWDGIDQMESHLEGMNSSRLPSQFYNHQPKWLGPKGCDFEFRLGHGFVFVLV